jgi:hypothetical protein
MGQDIMCGAGSGQSVRATTRMSEVATA